MGSPVQFDVRDRIAYLTLNRPAALNAIDEDVLAALPRCLEQADLDEAVKALVVGGAGEAFCVGLDIDLLGRAFADPVYFRDVLERYRDILCAIEALSVPVVAAVGGLARAGGFELLLACDLVVVAEEARIGDNHLAFGIVPGGGATQRAPRALGRQRARELVFTARWMDGREAASSGLALRSAPRARLGDAVEDLVAPLRTRSRAALAATKAAMNDGERDALRQGLDAEIERFMAFLTTDPAAAEGYRAFVERRDPEWP